MLVYDLGGGTLDVTVLELFEGVIEVKSSCGNNALGGKDFDQALIDHITTVIKKQNKVDVLTDTRAMMRIKTAAEQCKIALSDKTEYLIELPFLYSKDGNPAGYKEKITQTFFESLIREKIYSTEQQIKTALHDANLNTENIDLTLLVGGSTRIPLVSKFMDKTFNIASESAIDPDLSVVRGAAIQAGVLSGILKEKTIVLTDVCPYSLSTETLMNLPGIGFDETFCDVIIKRNTTLPVTASKMYTTAYDNQTQVHITAYQGESPDPQENYLLNCFELSGIPKGKAKKEKINIQFEYDLNGILTISAEIVSTGKSAVITVNTTQMGSSLDLSKWKDDHSAKKYRQIINKAERLIKIHGDKITAEIKFTADELKKAIVMKWEDSIKEKLKVKLIDAIDNMDEDVD